ncbi:MAG TPA: glycosyltransferase family 2 protein [Acidimicrobiia bacterium]
MPSDTPLVSVLMPALNAAETIEAAIGSVFAGSDVPAEILVADDGSTDGTVEMIGSMNDDRVKLLFTGGHRLGANAGRNVGLDAARGEWIAFLDPDDTWLPGRLTALLDVAGRTGSDWIADDILVVYVDSGNQVRATSTLFAQRGLSVSGTRPLSLEDLIRYDLGVLQPLIRRSLLEDPKIRFPGPATSDFLFSFWSLDAAGGGTLVGDAMYRYVKAETQQTMSHASPAFWLDSVESTADLLADTQAYPPEIVRALEKRLRGSMRRYDYLKARSELREREIPAALGRLLRNPSVLAVVAESAARRIGALRRTTAEDGGSDV